MNRRPAPDIDIESSQWILVRDILSEHVPRLDVFAFGSRARWSAKQYSDLDIVVMTDTPLSNDVMAALSYAFSESDLPWKVDVVDWAGASAEFRALIERDKVLIQRADI